MGHDDPIPGGPQKVWTYQYDQANKLQSHVGPNGKTTRYEWDPRGNMTAEINPEGKPTRYTWDYRNQMLEVTYPHGFAFTNTWNGDGQRIRTEIHDPPQDPATQSHKGFHLNPGDPARTK